MSRLCSRKQSSRSLVMKNNMATMHSSVEPLKRFLPVTLIRAAEASFSLPSAAPALSPRPCPVVSKEAILAHVVKGFRCYPGVVGDVMVSQGFVVPEGSPW